METFGDYAYYYDLFYGDKNYKHEAELVKKVIETYGYDCCNERKKVLSLGCGTGRHEMELSRLGYDMTGIDASTTMIELAKKFAVGMLHRDIEFIVSDIRTFIPNQKYDAVISLFHVMSYQNTNEDLILSLKTANHCLMGGGVFVFDVWYGPGVLSDKPAVRIKKVEDNENVLIRHAIPVMHADTDIVDVHYDVLVIDKDSGVARQLQEVHNMRYFFRPELEYMLHQTGFKLVTCLNVDGENKTDYKSWTAYFVAVKIDECI